MNDHIHLLEAYAELLRSWPDPELRKRTEELLASSGPARGEPGGLPPRPDGRVSAPVSFATTDGGPSNAADEACASRRRRPAASRMPVRHA